ncbi:MAG TPA: hypothetical protein VMS64_27185 [Candidatus Methylomirabilis sp.]|nr:hypothetical protein [Candidatus Methylomirabilis sp.]
MMGRVMALLGLGLLTCGCSLPPPSPSNTYGPQSRCLAQPQRGQDYSGDRPLVYLFCVESP